MVCSNFFFFHLRPDVYFSWCFLHWPLCRFFSLFRKVMFRFVLLNLFVQCELFTPAQTSSGLFSVYWPILVVLWFGWFQPCTNIQLNEPHFQLLGDWSNYYWYHCHLHVPQLFQLSEKIYVFVQLFTFFHFGGLLARQNSLVCVCVYVCVHKEKSY